MREVAGEFAEEYQSYLTRFDEELGTGEVGAFSKHKGRLIKRFNYDEFVEVHREHHEIAKTYFESVDRGDTINDVVVKLLRDRSIELVLPTPF